jgi:antitoxin component YwqK of YwqJK toxin-antitoxin module
MKKIISLLAIAILFTFSCTTRLPRNNINVIDNLNRKQGLWITSDTFHFIEVLRYKNGIPKGKYYRYYPKGQIDTYGKYNKGKKQNIWYYYLENGLLSNTETYKQDSIVTRTIITRNYKW